MGMTPLGRAEQADYDARMIVWMRPCGETINALVAAVREQVACEIEAADGPPPWDLPHGAVYGVWIDSRDSAKAARIARGAVASPAAPPAPADACQFHAPAGDPCAADGCGHAAGDDCHPRSER